MFERQFIKDASSTKELVLVDTNPEYGRAEECEDGYYRETAVCDENDYYCGDEEEEDEAEVEGEEEAPSPSPSPRPRSLEQPPLPAVVLLKMQSQRSLLPRPVTVR